MNFIYGQTLAIAGGIFLLWLVIKIFTKPMKLIFKLILNTGIGFLALWLVNFFGDAFGISLGLNWVNALTVGVLGFPGLVLLLLLKYLI